VRDNVLSSLTLPWTEQEGTACLHVSKTSRLTLPGIEQAGTACLRRLAYGAYAKAMMSLRCNFTCRCQTMNQPRIVTVSPLRALSLSAGGYSPAIVTGLMGTKPIDRFKTTIPLAFWTLQELLPAYLPILPDVSCET